MQHTLFTILTNKKARGKRAIAASLDKEFTAGVPWWSETVSSTSS